MSTRPVSAQLVKYLTDVHSIELQALEQLRVAPRMAGDPGLADAFRAHLDETREHERLVRHALERRNAAPSTVKDAAGRLGGWGMAAFARLNPDTPGKLAMHAYSYEHMEHAAYALLERFAERAGDDELAELARTISGQERAMAERIDARWDEAVAASLAAKGAHDPDQAVVTYLRDAHALEAQALELLDLGPRIAHLDVLATVFAEHRHETRVHQELVAARLAELGGAPPRLQAAAMRVSAMSLGAFFDFQPDTAVKLSGFAHAFEAVETGAYELLARTAARARDSATVALAERIAAEERRAAERVAATWDAAVDAAVAGLEPAR
ncbi:MAG TPA: DUF892 family protein [Solirubrobacteraceae bacterium]|jgi:ferritin-like metal-binding protein YciE